MSRAPAMTPLTTDRLRSMIEHELPQLIDIRRDLHAHPELCYDEHRTSELVASELTTIGVEHRTGLAGGTGVMAVIESPAASTSIGLRADMDALPIEEKTGLPYRSTIPGRMHACGHDGHTTILLGTARILQRLAAEGGLPRPVTLVFQPAEEGGGGGERMVLDGCLDGSVLGPPVERMFGLHGWPRTPLGVVGSRPGPMMASADNFNITLCGKGCHAAWPHVGNDPIVASGAVITALQTIASRNVGALESIVVSITRFDAGTAYNIIPDVATLGGTVRTLTPEIRVLAEQRLTEITRGIALAHGCSAEIDYELGYPTVINDEGATSLFHRVATESLGAERVFRVESPVMGGEDFAYYGKVVPACFFVLGLVPDGATDVPDLHMPTFDFNDDAIATGIEMFCRLATSG